VHQHITVNAFLGHMARTAKSRTKPLLKVSLPLWLSDLGLGRIDVVGKPKFFLIYMRPKRGKSNKSQPQ
jgi:hypothetical protein